ncbi:MAG TPA: hypothetical protein VKR53_21435 [Puia sp.]|nr:hypothetical protein [Puia sp.]
MSLVKSHSVGHGDMFYIKHNSDNFTIIDSFLDDDNKERILNELIKESEGKGIIRFISTHPDEDHICGLKYIDDKMKLLNFYCAKNDATKDEESIDFNRYCELRDSSKAFYLEEGCSRKWMNQDGNDVNGVHRGSSGINILWPNTNNKFYKEALQVAKEGGSPNNISVIIKYSLQGGVTILWMGDLETDFMENIKDDLSLPKVNILFAPHHGRDSGKVPKKLLEEMNPDVIIIGEAPEEHLNNYTGYNTIWQNDAEDILFDCVGSKVHIYASNNSYKASFLDDEKKNDYKYYLGTLNL